MVKIYVRKIRNGEMSLQDVPLKWREQVAQVLADMV